MTITLTEEEKKIIYYAVKYWQIHKSSHDGKDYKTCDEILNRLFDDLK